MRIRSFTLWIISSTVTDFNRGFRIYVTRSTIGQAQSFKRPNVITYDGLGAAIMKRTGAGLTYLPSQGQRAERAKAMP